MRSGLFFAHFRSIERENSQWKQNNVDVWWQRTFYPLLAVDANEIIQLIATILARWNYHCLPSVSCSFDSWDGSGEGKVFRLFGKVRGELHTLHKLITIRSYVNDWIHFEYNNRCQGEKEANRKPWNKWGGEKRRLWNMRDRFKGQCFTQFKLRRTHSSIFPATKCDSISITTSFTALSCKMSVFRRRIKKIQSREALICVRVRIFFSQG